MQAHRGRLIKVFLAVRDFRVVRDFIIKSASGGLLFRTKWQAFTEQIPYFVNNFKSNFLNSPIGRSRSDYSKILIETITEKSRKWRSFQALLNIVARTYLVANSSHCEDNAGFRSLWFMI